MGQRKMSEHVENTVYWIQGSRRESRRLPRRGKCCGGRGRRGPGTDELRTLCRPSLCVVRTVLPPPLLPHTTAVQPPAWLSSFTVRVRCGNGSTRGR